MKNKNKKTIATILVFAATLFPVMAYGASLIPCGQPAGTPNIMVGNVSYQTTNQCGFNDLMILANTLVRFLMFDVAIPLAALGFMFMGGKLILFSDKESAKTEAKEGLWNIATGFAIMLGSYVLIKVILSAFLNTDQGFMLFLIS